MHFTLVSTIFNEAKRLPQTIADLEAQTLQPTEIIITDAGSTDGTWEMLKNWQARSAVPIVLLQEQRCNVARGRNLAIAAAKCEFIVSTDFGCRFHPMWLENITKPFANTNVLVSGTGYTVIEPDIKTLPARSNYILSAGYKISVSPGFIPSSRSIAYRKEVWETIGGYPEWLTLAADDLVFGLKLRAKQIPIHLIDESLVYWGRHTKAKQYTKEAYRYGLGDGEAHVNFRNFISSSIETKLRYLLFVSIFIIPVLLCLGFSGWIALIPILLLPGLRSYCNNFKNWLRVRSKKYNSKAFGYSFYMMELQRVAYIKGYLRGLLFSSAKQKEEAKQLNIFLKSKACD